MKKIMFVIITGSLLIFASTYSRQSGKTKQIFINNIIITAEIADDDKKRAKGLSYRNNIREMEGMLFIFPNKDKHYFWMKDMLFPLDFIWIDGNKIIETSENIKPSFQEKNPEFLVPKNPVDKVLEVNAGFLQKNGIKVGDTVIIK